MEAVLTEYSLVYEAGFQMKSIVRYAKTSGLRDEMKLFKNIENEVNVSNSTAMF